MGGYESRSQNAEAGPQGANFQVEMTADPIEVPTSGGGQTIQFLENVKIRFDLPAGTSIETKLAGTSHADPGITWTTPIVLFNIEANSSCYAPVNPVLSTKLIV